VGTRSVEPYVRNVILYIRIRNTIVLPWYTVCVHCTFLNSLYVTHSARARARVCVCV
jgi:hypothetical protein